MGGDYEVVGFGSNKNLEDGLDDGATPASTLQPLEISRHDDDEVDHPHHHHQQPQQQQHFDTTFVTPQMAVSFLTLLLSTIVLLTNAYLTYDLTELVWPSTVFALHLLITVLHLRLAVLSVSSPCRCSGRWLTGIRSLLPLLLDLALFGWAYPTVWQLLIDLIFTEPDGTTVVDWSHTVRAIEICRRLSWLIVVMRTSSVVSDCLWLQKGRRWAFREPLSRSWTSARIVSAGRRVMTGASLVASLLVVGCCASLAVHWGPAAYSREQQQTKKNNNDAICDPVDLTECLLPFPSFAHLEPDPTTATGWRVHLRPEAVPLLRGQVSTHPEFLNQLDGFATMGPILFYVPGLKEAHEAANQQQQPQQQLPGPNHLAQSVTSQSVTWLVDVPEGRLLPHSAEIDYLDPHNPLVLLFPSQPLHHDRHYAVVVRNATDAHGQLLARTPAMQAMVWNRDDDDNTLPNNNNNSFNNNQPPRSRLDLDRYNRYVNLVLPAVQRAADWRDVWDNPPELQLLFDFWTVSESAQLGPVRAARDRALAVVSNDDWSWPDHVRTVQTVDYDRACDEDPNAPLARTIHAELDVPWFLQDFGPGHRAAFLSTHKLNDNDEETKIGTAKFVVNIPCSVRAAARGRDGSRPIRSIVEFGHGLFADRMEVMDDFMLSMAHDEGYVTISMDWRGMSTYDLPVVVKTLISRPGLFQAIRDNLIQGFANRYVMQHFAHHEMLRMDWFQFNAGDGTMVRPTTADAKPPSYTFYGISQGGILGGGYVSLSGVTGLIDRAVLGVPGTSFALIMTRSLEFQLYDLLLMMNFQCNRHVRIFLTMIQMGWDSTEGSGVLAQPVNEPYPRMLLQAGLGDSIVPYFAAEFLARALDASLLPEAPKDVYGLKRVEAASGESLGPSVTLSELMYDADYNSLPDDNVYPNDNDIHVCVRRDRAMMNQVKEFISTGRIVDPCEGDNCHRTENTC